MPKDDPKIPPFGPARIPALATSELTKGLAAIKTEDALRARAKRERRQEAVWAQAAKATEAELAAHITARRAAAPAPAAPARPPSPTPEPVQIGLSRPTGKYRTARRLSWCAFFSRKPTQAIRPRRWATEGCASGWRFGP